MKLLSRLMTCREGLRHNGACSCDQNNHVEFSDMFTNLSHYNHRERESVKESTEQGRMYPFPYILFDII